MSLQLSTEAMHQLRDAQSMAGGAKGCLPTLVQPRYQQLPMRKEGIKPVSQEARKHGLAGS